MLGCSSTISRETTYHRAATKHVDVSRVLLFLGFGAMGVTKPYKFIWFGAMDVTKPYEFIGFGAMDVTSAYLR